MSALALDCWSLPKVRVSDLEQMALVPAPEKGQTTKIAEYWTKLGALRQVHFALVPVLGRELTIAGPHPMVAKLPRVHRIPGKVAVAATAVAAAAAVDMGKGTGNLEGAVPPVPPIRHSRAFEAQPLRAGRIAVEQALVQEPVEYVDPAVDPTNQG